MRRQLGLTLAPALALLGVLAGACDTDDGGASMDSPPTWDDVRARVFEPSCAFGACHTGAAPAGGMNLKGDPYDQIVDIPAMQDPDHVRVEPGNPDASYLVMKLEGRGVTGTAGAMPPTEPLDAERIDLVRDWIAAGALQE